MPGEHKLRVMMRTQRLLMTAVVALLTSAALAHAATGQAPPGASSGPNCSRTSVGLTPLTDLGRGRYHGFAGGLYRDRQNSPPSAYLQAGLSDARRVRALARDGAPGRAGRIVLLSIGMSNVVIEFRAFQQLVAADSARNSHLVLVNGAQGGVDGDALVRYSDRYFATVDGALAAAGVTAAQVQAVWLKEAIAGEHEPFPADAQHLQRDLDAIIALLSARFPNLRLIYLASRIFAGYASSPLNPEPYAYDSGFAVKWTIARRVRDLHARPWVAWGPYLWADGTRPRRDGLEWTCSDFGPDGTHPSAQGAEQVARLLLRFFAHSPTTRTWFDATRSGPGKRMRMLRGSAISTTEHSS